MPSFAFTSWPCSRCKSEFASLLFLLFFFSFPFFFLSFLLLFISPPISLLLLLLLSLATSVATNRACVYIHISIRVSAWHVSNATHCGISELAHGQAILVLRRFFPSRMMHGLYGRSPSFKRIEQAISPWY